MGTKFMKATSLLADALYAYFDNILEKAITL